MISRPARDLNRCTIVCLAAASLAFGTIVEAANIDGVVQSATNKYATVKSDSNVRPVPGDKAKIYFKVPDTNVEVSVAAGHVYEITGQNIMIQIDQATGAVAKNQLVRITSPHPFNPESQSAPSKPANLSPPPSAITSPSPKSDSGQIAANEAPHTPAANSPERRAICDGARGYIQKKYVRGRLPQSIVFKIDHILATDHFCNMEAVPVFADGKSAVPEYLPDIAYNFCLERKNTGWTVIADLSRSDVPDQTQVSQIRARLPAAFPLSVLSPTWRKLLGDTANNS